MSPEPGRIKKSDLAQVKSACIDTSGPQHDGRHYTDGNLDACFRKVNKIGVILIDILPKVDTVSLS